MPAALINKIMKSSEGLTGQRREVTVLFVEIAHFDQVAQNLDSEDLFLAVDYLMKLLTDLIYKYEGTIDKFTGSGLMALFGIPLNHENDPERAVRAALEMQQTLQLHQQILLERYHHEIQIRIGINTGSVIAGRMGVQQHMEYTVIGDTVNLASHLLENAEEGSIYCSFSTYQRTRPIFDFTSLPANESPTDASPAQIFKPSGVRLKHGQVRGLPGLQVPMVGRSEDFRRLRETFLQVRTRGFSQIVSVSGEAGIGKTRLMAEFRESLIGQPVFIYQGTCAAYMRMTPYRVVADIVRSILHISELDPESVQREALRHHLQQVELDPNEILPYLLQVLGLLQTDPMLEVRIRLLEPAMLQRQTHQAIRTLFLTQARLAPVVLIFDDLHWVDDASRQFLEYFCQSLDETPILLVLISRDFEQIENAHIIQNAASKHFWQPVKLDLGPLSADASRLLVDQLINSNDPRASRIKSSIIQRSAGNPYCTEELVRMLIDHQALVHQRGGWDINPQHEEIFSEVPGTLQDIILARVDLLPPSLALALQKASILGQSFAVSLFFQMAETDGKTAASQLLELEERDFLIKTTFGIEDGYYFKHPLLRETIYNTLLKKDLRRFHLQAAQTIESGVHWLPGERNEVLAHHYSLSSAPEKAIPYLLSSAEKAAQNFANQAVIQLNLQALELMQTSKQYAQIDRDRAVISLVQALKVTGEFEDSIQMLQEVIQHYDHHAEQLRGNDQPELRLLLDALRELADIRAREGHLDLAISLLNHGLEILGEEGRQNFPSVWRRLADRLAWVYFRQSKLEEAYTLADMALLDLQALESDDPITLASLYNTIGGIYWTRSRLSEAIDAVQHSLKIYQGLGYHWGKAISLTNLGVLNYSLGKWEEAVQYLEQADELRREYGYDPERPVNLKNLGEILIAMGDHNRARQKLETSRDICERLGMEISQAYAEFGLCRLSVAEGKLAEASLHLENARQIVEAHDEANDRTAHFCTLEALVLTNKGNHTAALEAAQKSLQIIDEGGYMDEKADALRVTGLVFANLKDYHQAETMFVQSMNTASQQNDRFGNAKAQAELGRMYLVWSEEDLSQRDVLALQAEKSLDKAIELFEILGARHELHRAQVARALVPASRTSLEAQIAGSIELQNGSDQVDDLRTQLGLPAGEWYQAVIITIQLSPKEDAQDELVYETIQFLLPSLVQIIQEHGAQPLRHQAGLTAMFGVPVAQEDDPERAVNTAMQILNFYNMIYSQTQMPVAIRMGVSMGRIVAGKPGSDPEREFIAAGEALQTSHQLAMITTPARVWVTQSVRNATQFRFEFTPVPSALTANLQESTVFELSGLREQILPVRGLIGLKTPFVGRQAELETMQRTSLVLKTGVGRMIWLTGDPGIGKSRLMREFADRMSESGHLVWHSACTVRGEDVPFFLFSGLLAQAFDIQPNFSPEQIQKQFNLLLDEWQLDLTQNRPFLELLIGTQPSQPILERINSLEPEQLRRQTFVAVHRLISQMAIKKPLIIILDDLQWVDAISADLLLYLSHLVISSPILFLCAQRYKQASSFEQTLERTRSIHPDHFQHMFINPLSGEECRLLLQEFMSSAPLPEDVRSLIVQQSGGNPYFIEEFVRMLVEQDFLRVVRGRLEINQQLVMDSLSIPSSLETLIRARVDALPLPSRHLLQVASIIGQRFHRSLLARVADRDEVDPHLELLSTRGMLNHVDEAGFLGFSHPMIEVIVYNTVLRAQRKVLHSRTADVLEMVWADQKTEHAEDLAYHYDRAERYAQALYYLVLAGERAAARHANEVAVGHFERASEMLSAVPEASPELRWRLISGLGDVYQFIGNFDASLAALCADEDLVHNPDLSLAQRAGIFRRLGATAYRKGEQELAISYLHQALEILGEPQGVESEAEAATIYARMGWSYFVQANPEEAQKAVFKAMTLARHSNDLNALAAAENLLGGIYSRQVNIPEAVAHTRQAMSYWQEVGYSWGVAVTLSNLGILEVFAGDWAAAYDAMLKSLELRREMGDVEGVATNNNNLGSLCLDRGDLELAESYLRESLAIARPFRINFLTANSYAGLASSLIMQGKLDEVPEIIQEGRQLASDLNARDVLSDMERLEAEYHLAVGNASKAEEFARHAASLAEETGNWLAQARGLRLTSRCLLEQSLFDDAQQTLQSAWQALQQAPDEFETARWHALACRISKSLGDEEQFRLHAESARETFQRLGANHDLKLLKAFIQS